MCSFLANSGSNLLPHMDAVLRPPGRGRALNERREKPGVGEGRGLHLSVGIPGFKKLPTAPCVRVKAASAFTASPEDRNMLSTGGTWVYSC